MVIIVPSIMLLYQTDTLSRHHSFSPWITYFSKKQISSARTTTSPSNPLICLKTAGATPFGFFKFVHTLRVTQCTFNGLLIRCSEDFPSVTHTSTTCTQDQQMEQVFQRLSKYRIVMKPAKCIQGVSELALLGHRFSATGIRPLHGNISTRLFPTHPS